LPKRKDTDLVKGIKTGTKTDYGGTEKFSKEIIETNVIKFYPKEEHVGKYIIKVTSAFESLNLNFSMSYQLHVKVLSLPPLPPPPETLGERVNFKILRISKNGAV
jgi:hypothetical protein